ncbi:MAG: hypothetical protein K9L62_16290 [Vallitaleaceae bacterium]|nr:hypothetical protein [Vallitaleaceae bacterium]
MERIQGESLIKIDLTKPVKLINLQGILESRLIFRITNYNEKTNRVYITPINHDATKLPIPGEELVSVEELINV